MNNFLNNIRKGLSRIDLNTGSQTSSTKTRSRKLLILLGVLFVVHCYNIVKWAQDDLDRGWGVTLHVSPRVKSMDFYKRTEFSDGAYYLTGVDGSLYWKPKNLKEAILLNTFSGNSAARDAFEPFSLIAIIVIFGYVFKNIGNTKPITKDIISKFTGIVFLILLWNPAIFYLIKQPLGERYISQITHGQFEVVYAQQPPPITYLFILLMPLLYIFPNKVLELQKEQELTI